METMKVAAITGEKQAVLIDVSIPKPKENWVVVKIHASPMCTEYKAWLRGVEGFMGHEGSGEVVAVDQSTKLKIGDRVVVMPQLPCGECGLCVSGDYIHCEHAIDYQTFSGHEGKNETMAQYILKPDWILPKIPEGVSYDHAALACCALGPTFGAMERMKLSAPDTILITGMGPVGLGGVVNAKFRNARVIAVDLNDWRKAKATELGADLVLDATDPDALKKIKDLTGGLGVNAAIDCSGSHKGQRLAIDALRRRGTMAFVGESGNALELEPSSDMIRKGISLIGIWHYNLELFSRIMEVIQRSPLLDTLISHTFPLSNIQQAFETVASQEAAKIILHPWG